MTRPAPAAYRQQSHNKRSPVARNWQFFRAFIRSPRVVASIVPSSSFLERRVATAADISTADTVVELGAGTGGVTRALLAIMRTDAHLLAFERTAELATSLLDDVADARLRVVHGCASTVLSELEQHRFGKADAVVSGIPFTNLPEAIATTIIGRVYDALKPGGRFIAYQFTSRVADYARPVFGGPRVEIELCNVPPVRVFCWRRD